MGEAGQSQSALSRRIRDADFRQSGARPCWSRIVTPSRAGRFFLPLHSLAGGPHHGAAAERMQRKQPNARQLRGRGNRSSHGIGNVVELQVEEYPEPKACELLNRSRAFRRK